MSKETFTAIKHTSQALLKVCKYCIDELKLCYILSGKFQTDLEVSSANIVSLLVAITIYQCARCLSVKKIRQMSVLKVALPIQDKKVILSNFEETNWEMMESKGCPEHYEVNINETNFDFNK